MTAAADYISGALAVALVALALAFVYRTYQAIRHHYRRSAEERAGWVTVAALRTRAAPSTPAGLTRSPMRVGPAGTGSPRQRPR